MNPVLKSPEIVEIQDEWLRKHVPEIRFFTSLEGENPTGSMKDRMVYSELRELVENGTLRKGDCVSEVSAGSTARSLAFFCRGFGLRCVVFVPEGVPEELVRFLEGHGAEIHVSEMKAIYADYERYCANHKSYRFNQLGDSRKRRHYRELGAQIGRRIGPVSAVLAGVGTGHSLLGVREGLEPGTPAWTAEPLDMAVSGIRNLDRDSRGDQDCCRASDFDRRFTVSQSQQFLKQHLFTSAGEIEISGSFCVVLGAAQQLKGAPDGSSGESAIFLLGSSNRRLARPRVATA